MKHKRQRKHKHQQRYTWTGRPIYRLPKIKVSPLTGILVFCGTVLVGLVKKTSGKKKSWLD